MILQFHDLYIYNPEENILSIGDVHIGLEEAINKAGWLIPRYVYPEIKARVKKTLEKFKAKKPVILLLGDIKHEFGRISEQEWRDAVDFIDFLSQYGKLVMIKGNHDTIMGPIATKKNIELVDEYVAGEYYYCHGDRIPETLTFQNAKTIIIGHEHPAVSLRESAKVEKYKCFLVGKWKKKTLIVQPSIHTLTEGTDILAEKLLSPFLIDIRKFKVHIVGEDKVYEFGTVRELQEME
ncbi:MAG: metallophosphoesterase [Candidatus Woesearchaeota archaeon]